MVCFYECTQNGSFMLGHMLQTNQLNDQKIRMNDIKSIIKPSLFSDGIILELCLNKHKVMTFCSKKNHD